MLYTVIPLEQIYKSRRTEEAEYKDIMMQHGRVVAKREGDYYVVEKVLSTDPSDYLNENLFPGMKIEN